MCGIHAAISKKGFQVPSEELKDLLCNRGPDHLGEEHSRIDTEDGTSYWITLTSTVLALRGGHVTAQPFLDTSSGSVLCWNGEAWKIGSDPVVGNDGQAVFDLLIQASSAELPSSESTVAILTVLQSISGPFAFVFLDRIHSQVYFGRDRLGRRSLLCRTNNDLNTFELSSIGGDASSWEEVEADAIYQLSFDSNIPHVLAQEPLEDSITAVAPVCKHPWATSDSEKSVSFLLRRDGCYIWSSDDWMLTLILEPIFRAFQYGSPD